MLGHELSFAQRGRLLAWKDGHLAIVLDNDAEAKAKDICRDLRSLFGNNIFCVSLPAGCDPADMARDAIYKLINCNCPTFSSQSRSAATISGPTV